MSWEDAIKSNLFKKYREANQENFEKKSNNVIEKM